MQITKIVLTGGPCAGKSTAMAKIQDTFNKMGYVTLFVPETASELILGGVVPWSCKTFQENLFALQSEKERIFEEAAKGMGCEKVLIVCDRGLLDGKTYMTEKDFKNMLKGFRTNEVKIRDNYDAVFHLVTAAKGAEEFYTYANNAARTETVEQAAIQDDKLIAAWTGHPHFRIIDNSTDFETKIHRLLSEISAFLGEPEPFEIERKFLIKYPDLEWLNSNPNCQKVQIIQTYLKSDDGDEVRVRQRGENGQFIYTKTIKRKVSDVKRVEIEHRISQEEYCRLLMDADPNCYPVRKDRYCLTYDNQYFEIDIYPMWSDKAIMEIELGAEDVEINFPDGIEIIKEVTSDESYKNYSLAKNRKTS